MKSIQEFLKINLQKIADDFSNLTITFGYNEYIRSYVVKIDPSKEYHSNEKLDKAWELIYNDFYKMFPCEDIVFTSIDSEISITENIEILFSLPNLLLNSTFNLIIPTNLKFYSQFYHQKDNYNILLNEVALNYFTSNQELNSSFNLKPILPELEVTLDKQYTMAA